jgi:hypothetical protein
VRRFLALITDPQEGLSLPWNFMKLDPEYYITQTKALERGLVWEMEYFDELQREASTTHSRKGSCPTPFLRWRME